MSDNLSFEQIEILRFLRSQDGCTVSRERFFEAFLGIKPKTYTALSKLGYLKVDSEADPISLTDSGKGLIDEYLADKEEKQYQREYNADILKTAQEANEFARDANVTAKEANAIAREANKRADRANAISIVALVISAIAILASIFVR